LKFVLITGVSSGIGLYLAKLFAEQSYSVIGTYRNIQFIDSTLMKFNNVHLIKMDVADESSIENAFTEIRILTGEFGLYALINNAGIAMPGPISHLSIEKMKYLFEVNVFGPVKMIQLALDLLIKYGPGSRIINISSVSGLFASPFLGAYASSKFAIEGLSDSLRRELELLNIKVIVIEPGSIKTKIWGKHLNVAEEFKNSPYTEYLVQAKEVILSMEEKAIPVDHLKKPMIDALESPNPKTRYLIRKNKILFCLLAKYLPVPLVDFLVQRNLKSGKRKIRPI
jgi:NAD(P)-dependent dehydrogenase (short-subunit alcohol dehydrogenase family)